MWKYGMILAAISLAGCGSSMATGVRNGPQTVHPVYGTGVATVEAVVPTHADVQEQPVAYANEFNRNSGIYSAGFAAALAVSRAR